MKYPEDFVNQIVCMDNIKAMQLIPANSIEMVLTDIPYAVINRPSQGLRNLNKQDADILTFDLSEFISESIRICSGSIYIFCSTEQVSLVRQKLIECGLITRLGIWEKTNPSPMNGQYVWLSGIECCVYGKKHGATFNEHCKNTVWRYATVRGKRHPTEKPLKLFKYLIETSSNPNDTIADFCLGSGTTAVAAKLSGRNFVGVDISKEYCKIAQQRLNETK